MYCREIETKGGLTKAKEDEQKRNASSTIKEGNTSDLELWQNGSRLSKIQIVKGTTRKQLTTCTEYGVTG